MIKIAILTPLLLEMKAVMAHISEWREVLKNGDLYFTANFKGENDTFQIILRETGSKNNVVALAAQKIISDFQPNIIFLTGIAGGVKDVNIGDVVIGTTAYGYDSGKEKEGQFFARPIVYPSSKKLDTLAKLVNHQNKWQNRIDSNTDKIEVFFGPIASGDKVIADINLQTFQLLKSHYNDTIALEMEAFGLGTAMHNHPNIPWINIRGISDLLEGKNAAHDLDRQPIAAKNAAAFLFEMIYKIDIKQLNIPIMDLNTLTGLLTTALSPFLKESKSVKAISKEIAEASDTTLSSIWDKIKHIFIEEFEKEGEEVEASVAAHALKKKIKRDDDLKKVLEELLEKREGEKPGNSTVISNSKNAVGGNVSGNNNRIGDNISNSHNTTTNNIDTQNNISGNTGSIHIGDVININQIIDAPSATQATSNFGDIQTLIAQGKIKQAIEGLLAFSKTKDSDFQNQAILLASRWNGLRTKVNGGVISSSDANIERNRILMGVMGTLDNA